MPGSFSTVQTGDQIDAIRINAWQDAIEESLSRTNDATVSAEHTWASKQKYRDDVRLAFGTGEDHWWERDSTNGRLRLRGSDVDGQGTAGDIMRIDDGQQGAEMLGALKVPDGDSSDPQLQPTNGNAGDGLWWESTGGSVGARVPAVHEALNIYRTNNQPKVALIRQDNPGADTPLGDLRGRAPNAGGVKKEVIRLAYEWVDDTAGSEDGRYDFEGIENGSPGSTWAQLGPGRLVLLNGEVRLGSAPATVNGGIGLENQMPIEARNGAGDGNVELLRLTSGDAVRVNTDNHELILGGGSLGFFGTSGQAQDVGWSVSNLTDVRSFDADNTTVDELADVVGTLIVRGLKGYNLLG